MRACLFLALLVATAAADPLGDYRAAVRRLGKQERKYWSDFRNDFNAAYQAWVAPTSGRGGVNNEAINDFTEFRALFLRYRKLNEALAKADLELATSGHAKAYEVVSKRFLATCRAIDKAEAEVAEANPIRRYLYDPRPAVLRDGLEIRLVGLINTLATWPELGTTGWKRAKKGDGKRSFVRRVAVIDALGIAGAKDVLGPLVKSKEIPLRAAIAESLFDRAALLPLLDDESPVVRRALLGAIADNGGPKWIGPVIDALKRTHGQEQVDAVAALTALSGQPFGHDAPKWTEWFEDYRTEIDEGRFDRTKVEIQETKPVPPKEQYRFYGIPSSSRMVAIVTLGSALMSAPVDWDRRRERNSWDWATTRKQWESATLPSHRTYLERQFEEMLDRFPAKGVYGLVLLQGKFGKSSEKMLGLGGKDVAFAKKMLKTLAGRGWCAPMRGLQVAAALGPLDTIYLVNDGELQGGHYITPELVVAAFKRWNRFRRIVLHAIRIDNQKEPGETLMKGLAEVSGGSYVWLKAPEKR